MALFHLTSKIHGKTTKSGNLKGVSSVVAYRHCFAMGDYNYTNKKGFVDSFMMMPEDVVNAAINHPNLDKFFDQEVAQEIKETIKNGDCVSFWQAIETKEKRKDAQFCEELIISLQHELSLEENIKNLKDLINENYIKQGKAADICIHNPDDNLHAHVLITQRPLLSIGVDMEGKPTYEFGNKIRNQLFSVHGKMDQITPVREMWANLCNASFEKAGLDISISEKSLKTQREIALAEGNEILAAELDREPVKHISLKRFTEEETVRAKWHNDNQLKMYIISKELAEDGVILYDEIIHPEFEPTTFREKLEQRKQNRIERIAENVARYIKARADKYSSIIGKVRKRATSTIHAVAALTRNQQKGIFNQVVSDNFEQARANVKATTTLGELEYRKLKNAERNKCNIEAENAKQLRNELDKDLKLWHDSRIKKWEYGAYKPDWAKLQR